MDAELTIAVVPWAKDQPAKLRVPRRPFDPEQRAALEQLHQPCPFKSVSVKHGAGTIAVQFWVDAPGDTPSFRSDARVRAQLDEAVRQLLRLVDRRAPDVAGQLHGPVAAWVEHATCAERSRRVRSELSVTILEGFSAALVGVDSQHRAGSGAMEDLGLSLMLAVGPDRYGIRVRPPGDRQPHGDVIAPSGHLEIATRLYVDGLREVANALSDDVRALESEVVGTLLSGEDLEVQLARTQALLTRRVELDAQRVGLKEGVDRLTSGWRKKAFLVGDQADEFVRLEERLLDLRTRLIDVPQLLLAATSVRMAKRTETLSLIAGALLPATLLVGALGANVLPWQSSDARAVVGMVVLTLALIGVSACTVKWWLFRGPKDEAPHRTGLQRRDLVLVGSLFLALVGGWLLLAGTSVGSGG